MKNLLLSHQMLAQNPIFQQTVLLMLAAFLNALLELKGLSLIPIKYEEQWHLKHDIN